MTFAQSMFASLCVLLRKNIHPPIMPDKPRLLDQVRDQIQLKHYIESGWMVRGTHPTLTGKC